MKVKHGNRLRVLRAERDVTQIEVAAKAGMSPAQFWRIETGLKVPDVDELKSLAKALKVDIADLGFRSSPSQVEAKAS